MYAEHLHGSRSAAARRRRRTIGPLAAIWRASEGTAAIEFAVIVPLFVTVIVGIFAIGWATNGVMAVRHALDQTGRQLLLNPTLTQQDMQKTIDGEVAYLGDPNVSVQLAYDTSNGSFTVAHVTASYPFTIRVPFLNDLSLKYQSSIAVPLKAN